jgi:hypothetical protein
MLAEKSSVPITNLNRPDRIRKGDILLTTSDNTILIYDVKCRSSIGGSGGGVWTSSQSEKAIFRDLLDLQKKNPNIRLVVNTSEGESHEKILEFVKNFQAQFPPDRAHPSICIC